MVSRGVFQLKKLTFFFCDFGGSSKGTREFLASEELQAFMKENPQIKFEFYQKRNNHPSCTPVYINGYLYDIPLRNKDPTEILAHLQRCRDTFGRKPLIHKGKKVTTNNPSIQGGWKINMWNNFPKHKLEKIHRLPQIPPPQLKYREVDTQEMGRRRDFVDFSKALVKAKLIDYSTAAM